MDLLKWSKKTKPLGICIGSFFALLIFLVSCSTSRETTYSYEYLFDNERDSAFFKVNAKTVRVFGRLYRGKKIMTDTLHGYKIKNCFKHSLFNFQRHAYSKKTFLNDQLLYCNSHITIVHAHKLKETTRKYGIDGYKKYYHSFRRRKFHFKIVIKECFIESTGKRSGASKKFHIQVYSGNLKSIYCAKCYFSL